MRHLTSIVDGRTIVLQERSPLLIEHLVIGSLISKALLTPLPLLANSLRATYPTAGVLANLVSGPGVWNANPAGGQGSMTPARRIAVVEICMT